jgi:hypothetical protein
MARSAVRAAARPAGVLAATLLVLAAPANAGAHGLSPAYQSPLPLGIYLVGAAAVVGMSFVFVIARDLRATAAPPPGLVRVPRAVGIALRVVGLVGWGWIMAQGIAGGSSDAAVAGLFLWVYGWVGVAMLSALVFPVWEWLDPFASLFDIGAWALRLAGVRGWTPSGLPDRLRVWPAVAGFGFFVWLELVLVPGTSALTLLLAGYTLLTLALMAQVGRDAWRAGGETFSVWFRTLNRLAPYGLATPADARAHRRDVRAGRPDDALDPDAVDSTVVLRRAFATGLLDADWRPARIVLVALAVASIIFDGLSQTVTYGSVFGTPGMVIKTLELVVFLAVVVGAALLVARALSANAIGAGLLPIAVGYLVAHYLTYLLFDGQRILVAMSDPLQSGADLLGTAFFQVQTGWLPPGLVWTAQLAAVVGGHMLGAWGGHVSAQRDVDAMAKVRPPRDLRHRKIRSSPAPVPRNVRVRELPLALVMVALSTLTLWSLGQAIVREQPTTGAMPPAEARQAEVARR